MPKHPRIELKAFTLIEMQIGVLLFIFVAMGLVRKISIEKGLISSLDQVQSANEKISVPFELCGVEPNRRKCKKDFEVIDVKFQSGNITITLER